MSDNTSSDEEIKQGSIADDQPENSHFIDLPSRWDRFEPLAELVATILLAVATLATAWSGYQSARWGGVQSSNYSEAGALRTESTRASTQAGQLTQIDIGLFTNWINAFAAENQELADFYEARFRPEFVPAFEAWIATEPRNNPDAPKSPFAMDEYSLELQETAFELELDAEEKFKEGTEANQISDDYILNTVILASVLFLAGMQSRMRSVPARMSINLFALAILAYGLVNIIQYPVN